MKKAFAVIVCLWALFGICGCGANPASETETVLSVFLGFPNWWYTVPMAVHSFLEEYDFSGKTVLPFVIHGTGGMAGTIEDMTASLPDSANILEPIGIFRSEVEGAQETVNGWLAGLGFTETVLDAAQTGEKTMILTVNGQDIKGLLYDTPVRLTSILKTLLSFFPEAVPQ